MIFDGKFEYAIKIYGLLKNIFGNYLSRLPAEGGIFPQQIFDLTYYFQRFRI